MGLKEEMILVLEPVFGESIKQMIEKFYDNSEQKEIIEMAQSMLSGYMGAEMGNKLLKKVVEKYHIEL